MECDYCHQLNCKKHIKCICKYCKYTCFTKETFKKHKCPIFSQIEQAEERYKTALQKIYLDARLEIQLMTKLNEESEFIKCELQSKIKELNQLNFDLMSQMNKLKLVQVHDKRIYENHAKQMTLKDIEVVELKHQMELLIRQKEQEMVEIQKKTNVSMTEMEKSTQLQIETMNTEYQTRIENLEETIRQIQSEKRSDIESQLTEWKEMKTEEFKSEKLQWMNSQAELETKYKSELHQKTQLYDELVQKYNLIQYEIKSVQHQLDQKNQLMSQIQNEYTAEIETLKVESSRSFQELSTKYTTIQTEYKSTKDTLHVLQSDTDRQIQELTHQNKEWSSKNIDLTIQSKALTAKYATMVDEFKKIKSDYDKLDLEYKSQSSEYETLKRQYKEFEHNYQATIQSLSKSIQDEKQQNLHLKQEVQLTQSKMIDTHNLQILIRDKETRVHELEQAVQAIKSEKVIQSKELSYMITSLKEITTSKTLIQKELDDIRIKYDDVHTKWVQVNKEVFSIRQKAEEYKKHLEQEIIQLKENAKEKTNMVEDYSKQLSDLKRNNHKLFLEKRDMENMRYTKDQDISNLKEQIDEKQKTIDSLVERIQHYEDQNQEIKQLKQSNHAYKLRISEIKTEHAQEDLKKEKIIEAYKLELEEARYQIMSLKKHS